MKLLSVRNIEKRYGHKFNVTKAIDGVSFGVDAGEFVAIMGPSGSGKTTLLNCISTIDTVSSGQILLEGTDITKLKGAALSDFRRKNLGFIFQDFNLLDTLTAYENIALALSIQKIVPDRIDERVNAVAKQLGIADVLEKYPYQMSGGQKQRVAAARAVVTSPRMILADEPTGALDSKSAKMLLERLSYLNQRRGATILMVTHDSLSASYASRIIFLKDGKLFYQLKRGQASRKQLFGKILRVVATLEEGQGDAR
ncbi:MAG: ABC transporter ATP-binding protein [Atopobiaceae bacterium]|nr:ABC transporter ATP-binding protein [Atopobiaceae bacterium]